MRCSGTVVKWRIVLLHTEEGTRQQKFAQQNNFQNNVNTAKHLARNHKTLLKHQFNSEMTDAHGVWSSGPPTACRFWTCPRTGKVILLWSAKLHHSGALSETSCSWCEADAYIIRVYQERNQKRELPEKPKPKAPAETEANLEKKEEEDLRWAPRLNSYSQTSTLHGLRQIWEPTPFRIRR